MEKLTTDHKQISLLQLSQETFTLLLLMEPIQYVYTTTNNKIFYIYNE